ncbi:chemotaxis-specific protein-glutamate methyltransferase CheB [Sphingomonadaceae bacterium G21617-S1]|uniref:chemotaxis-specific protein-glutamate methyltransferase CheB n=1 Tax=Rhizorhabdus sp. TaxID=1968843 RepID=UPI001212DF48|nr:chemotaxis-specific protein-glutamate methyltransferase CheB [Rhizorhabdus sp.]MBD3761128.1 chemotaxis-specific protein-glutamate methyltransferase CheB [Rhizorhabdus sp.]MCZ4343623.1 chemotaxis-specific protein-glutamate methyltransferase CheB [Sphingomonadaceae bacterium G21617-S1]TAK12931.1 MAG: chemotaxis-specific protein-glutamate methyltransferase CheB [Rhizorhabdus sp.]
MTLPRRARVLIVDDSITMRAFFGAIFERHRNIEVVGTAASADEARRMMIDKRPNVVTLDVEMPGMSGLDFLTEIMRDRPTPVIMLSSLTQKGAETSFEALERGAVDCFPKPASTNREEFAEKLCALVLAASTGSARVARYAKDAPARTPTAASATAQAGFDWNGKIVTISASTGGVDALLELLPAFPANCPPTVITLAIDPDFVPPLLQRLNSRCPAKVLLAEDGRPLQPGVVQIACDPGTHAVIDRWPNPSLRLLRSDPVNGARPSASLLFATAAKTAGAQSVGAILTGIGADGVAGLKALRATGALTISQDSLTCLVDQAPAAARAAGAVELDLPIEAIAATILDSCRRQADAAA